MGMVNKYGKTVVSMMDNGRETKPMDKELLSMLMEMFTRVNG